MSPGTVDSQIAEYQFLRGALRGTQLALLDSRLLHFGTDYTESTALDAIASVRIAFERDARRIGWGVALGAAALIVFALAGPLGASVGRGLAEVSAQVARDAVQASALAQFLASALGVVKLIAGLMPAAALALALWGAALAVLGWIGHTSLALVLASAEREFRVPGREPLLIDFAESLSEAVASRMRR
jgi:hypothetical protein